MNANTPWRRLFLIPVVVALFVLAGGAGPAFAQFQFFQGFEIDTSNWFPDGFATVDRVPSGDPSVDYNGGGTSKYADGINAALGGWFGRVTSAISTSGPSGDPTKGSCVIDLTGAIGPSLLCYGPYTLFGRDITVPFPFPDGGYTIQVDIFLDVNYATQHPDCITGPCTPGTLIPVDPAIDLNPDCATKPNGINCEGTRFDWTVAINNLSDPTAEIAPEFVFSVGTAPSPSWGLTGCDSGWIITAGYNSYRSGGDTYNPGFEPKCLSDSGWYTFQQVYKDDGTGKLEVDFSILDQSGNVVACKDLNTGTASTCSWVRYPVNPATKTTWATSDVGCPRYGWFANEEINDLPIDNTVLIVDGCGLASKGQIAPTGTTCQQYAAGTAATLDLLAYTLKGDKINSVSPGVFFYYAPVSGSAGQVVKITESHTGIAPDIDILKSQVVLYSDTCSKLACNPLVIDDGSATCTLPSNGSFIIGVKYDSTSLKGENKPTPQNITYTFGSGLSGNSNKATIDLNIKK